MIYRLATIPHNWHTTVRYDSSGSSKVNNLPVIWKPICDFLLVINSNLGSISHFLATIHPWRTDRSDGQTEDNHANSSTVILKYGRLKTRNALYELKKGYICLAHTGVVSNFHHCLQWVVAAVVSLWLTDDTHGHRYYKPSPHPHLAR